MTSTKKLKVRCGRISKVVRLPDGLHQSIKNLARLRSVTAAELYDQIISKFIKEAKKSSEPMQYLFHQSDSKKIYLYLKEEDLMTIKNIGKRDFISDNRVIFTAIMQFSRENV